MIIADEPMDAYHAHRAVSSSMLRDYIRLGPRAYYLRHVRGEAPGYDSAALTLGRAFDDLVFEPDRWDERYAVKPPDHNGRTKEGRAWVAEQARAGRAVLSQEDYDACQRMLESLKSNAVASALLEAGDYQTTIRVDWPGLTGLQARPDVLGLEGIPESGFRPFDCNVKTTSSLDRWPHEIHRLGYHVQVGVTDLCMRELGRDSMRYALAVVEKAWPHRCQVYWLSDAYVGAGRETARRGLERLEDHYQSDHWPLVEHDETEVEPPAWLAAG